MSFLVTPSHPANEEVLVWLFWDGNVRTISVLSMLAKRWSKTLLAVITGRSVWQVSNHVSSISVTMTAVNLIIISLALPRLL